MEQRTMMAQHPHLLNISVRPLQPEQWRWQHDWPAHQHQYHGNVTIRLERPGPGVGGVVPLTFHTRVTLDLGVSDPFAQHPPFQGEVDMMDIDLPGDFIFHDVDEDSDMESDHVPTPVYSPLPEGGTADHPIVILSDSEPSDDEGTGLDESMSDFGSDDEDEVMDESSEEEDLEDEEMDESSEEEDPEEEVDD